VGIGTLLIRADASPAIGTGHVMRCIALAQAWQDAGGQTVFTMAQSTEAIRARIRAESFETLPISSSVSTSDDLLQTIALLQQQHCEWIAVDGYQFGMDYQSGLKAAGFKVLFLDDFGHSHHYSADIVLNQNVSATPALYSNRGEYTRLILGPRYALLRREFSIWSNWQRTFSPSCRHLLVTMGGSDEENVTATAIEALHLAGIPELEATVIVGGSNPNFAKLQNLVARSGRKIVVRKDVSNIAELMAGADVAISAAGTACWELCLLGLPALLIDVADNQTALAEELQKRACAIHVGNRMVRPETIAEKLKSLIESLERRQLLSKASRELVDGRGAMRVVSVLCGQRLLRLRPVRNEDRRLLWEWANDPDVRAASFTSDPIEWETHVSWFDAKMEDSCGTTKICRMFIAEDGEGIAVGQIRFERRADAEWDVGISLSKDMRGRGFASELIERGVRELRKLDVGSLIHACVKPENIASVKAFEGACFENCGTEQILGQAAVHLIYR